jgi:hypothetical protein
MVPLSQGNLYGNTQFCSKIEVEVLHSRAAKFFILLNRLKKTFRNMKNGVRCRIIPKYSCPISWTTSATSLLSTEAIQYFCRRAGYTPFTRRLTRLFSAEISNTSTTYHCSSKYTTWKTDWAFMRSIGFLVFRRCSGMPPSFSHKFLNEPTPSILASKNTFTMVAEF